MESKISDKLLIAGYRSGNSKCIELLIRRYKNRVYSYILMTTKDKNVADDIFQETFIKVIDSLRAGAYTDDGRFIQWIMRIARNKVIDYFRKEQRNPLIANNPTSDIFSFIKNGDDTIEEQIVMEQIHGDVAKLVEFLPEDQRTVLMMRFYENLSFKEIAELTNVSINTALGRMRYAIINLRKIIKENNIAICA